jgi:DNA-directed RNA polymerase specialized sigma24 family protein
MAEDRAEQAPTGLVSVMRAVLALLADEREARIAKEPDARKTEELLEDAGFSIGEIASLLGKPYRTVQSTLRIAHKKRDS